ncbi:MAG: M15 family metallopeptidase [Candidatus Melainabacteria bacterium]|nr:M15 family metallopeptidase [Candidatus Melainabacteria bacterium]
MRLLKAIQAHKSIGQNPAKPKREIVMCANKIATPEDLRERPIPLREVGAASAHDYHDVPILLDSELATEPLHFVGDHGLASESYYARRDGLNAPYYKSFATASKKVHLRKTVVEKLVSINRLLERYNAELYLMDGFRPIELQFEVWDDFVAQARSVMDNPTDEECAHYAGFYCSDPRSFDESNFKTWPTHSTGGAIDLSLRSLESKQELFFGSVFDDATEISYSDHFEKVSNENSSASIVEARRNRRLLYWAMLAEGFANYPYEWWHFDWGTQMWVTNSKEQSLSACYGYMKKPASYDF